MELISQYHQILNMKTSSITPSEKDTFSSPRSKVALDF